MDRWVGKVAVVTGASSGIGADLTLRLANLGLTVIGFARRKQLIEDLAKKVTGSGTIHGKQADLSKHEDIKEAFQWVEENYGAIHILVNNAAVLYEGNITVVGDKQLTDDNISLVIDVNFRGLVLSTRLGVENMKKNNVDGHIVNINSVVGHYVPVYPYSNVYNATKHAVTAFTTTLVNELARHQSKIKVTSISPGVVYTEMVADLLKEDELRIEASDVTEAIVYALSTPPNVNIYELGIKAVGEGKL